MQESIYAMHDYLKSFGITRISYISISNKFDFFKFNLILFVQERTANWPKKRRGNLNDLH